MRSRFCLIITCFCFIRSGSAQIIYERHTSEVYNYLSRFAQKGFIIFDDNIRPISKQKIKEALDSVSLHADKLTETERRELAFYQREFTEGVRKRILSASNADFSIHADPIVTASYTAKGNGGNIKQKSIGLNLWGNASKHWGYQFSFQDVSLSGTGLDSTYSTLESGAATGPVLINNYTKNKQNYVEIRGHISYQFKNGSVSAGQDYLLWGYGDAGRIVLSDKAPTYPYIRFDYKPLPWLSFNYTHAWLQSNLLDSSRSYTIPSGIFSGIREVNIAKYMASHSIDFTLKKGLNFMVGESIIYNDRLNIGYLIPVMFFKAVDNNSSAGAIERGSNGQFFFQLNSRNQIKNTQLFATLFIDEIRTSVLFDSKKQRNQLGYTIGGSRTDLFGVSYLTIGAEYTRIRPFVYRNFLPAQNYTHAGYLLGDWMGNNADRISASLRYTPLAKLKLYSRYSYIRKGGAGTLDQQYTQETQPPFLFDFQRSVNEFYVNASYEYINRLYLSTSFRKLGADQAFFIGMTYGL